MQQPSITSLRHQSTREAAGSRSGVAVRSEWTAGLLAHLVAAAHTAAAEVAVTGWEVEGLAAMAVAAAE